MGKFMKGCAWTALILIVVGLIMAKVAGTVKGASTIHEVVDKVTNGIVQVNLDDIDENSIFDKNFEVFKGDFRDSILAENIQKLDIEVGGCEFTIKESADEMFHVEAEGVNKFQCYEQNNTLHIKGTIMKKVVTTGVKACNITLYVPTGFTFEKVDMEVGAGVMNLGSLSAEKFDLEVGAGRIIADSLIGEEMFLAVGVGECIIEDMQAKKLDAEVSMGNLDIQGAVSEKILMECAMGNIEMLVEGAMEDYDYNIECGMGNVNFGEDSYSGASEKSVNNGASRKIDVECALGNIDISFTK